MSDFKLVFNTKKVFLFGVLIALMYGLSPLVSVLLFRESLIFLHEYLAFFLICFVIFVVSIYPRAKYIKCSIDANEKSLRLGMLIVTTAYLLLQYSLYGDFTTAFFIPYRDRSGFALTGIFTNIYYPLTVCYTSVIFLFAIFLWGKKEKVTLLDLAFLAFSVVIFALLGSRNLLLWGFSAIAALFITKLRDHIIFLLVLILYIAAVLFAYFRNSGIVGFLLGNIDHLYYTPEFDYFDPLIHEFGSPYQAFELIYNSKNIIDDAPYGLLESFFINQLPSFLKPKDFISFTEYLSFRFAAPGEGIGSSPMTEAYFSNFFTLAFFILILTFIKWPTSHSKKYKTLKFFTYCLAVAVIFNIWRIGSAEVFKMFLSNITILLLLSYIFRFRLISFSTHQK
jgi:hypothetical protein